MKRIFFYGLFMDANLLRYKGFHPNVIGAALLPGYQIRIGKRASLVPNAQSAAYGMLMDLPEEEATELYAAPDVSDYVPGEVKVTLLSDSTPRSAECYLLPADKLGAKSNAEYAEQLSALVLRLGFPAEYANEILRQDDA